MRHVVMLGLAGLLTLTGRTQDLFAQQAQQESCVTCHAALDERLSSPTVKFAEDIHSAKGFTCTACHGGDGSIMGMGAMAPGAGFLGKPSDLSIPQFCGRCHADAQFMRNYNPSLRVDQVAEYETSVHGRRLIQFGDTSVATCVGCHPAHSIKPPSDPNSSVHPANVARTCGTCHANAGYMERYAIPTDQLTRYEQSVHYQKLVDEGDISAPTCNDCHGNHGAAPPGVSWVGNVCGQCHAVMADYFSQSRHAGIFAMLGVPGCSTCHGNHAITVASDSMLGMSAGAVCSEGQFQLGNAQSSRVQARAAIHAFSVDSVARHADEGQEITVEAWGRGSRALRELRIRRIGLAVSVGLILALVAGIVMKIRQTEAARAQ
jgi:hypothetical protein